MMDDLTQGVEQLILEAIIVLFLFACFLFFTWQCLTGGSEAGLGVNIQVHLVAAPLWSRLGQVHCAINSY